MEKHYRCWTEIDRSALRHNVAFVREKFGPDIDLLAVVNHCDSLFSPGLTADQKADLGEFLKVAAIAVARFTAQMPAYQEYP